jgi:hypothetical protein
MMDLMVLLIYRTPTGRLGRRNVSAVTLHATIARLARKGYTGFRAL